MRKTGIVQCSSLGARQAHPVGVIIVRADKAGATDRAEMFGRELGRMEGFDEVLSSYPGELRRPDRRAGSKRGSMPAPAPGAVTVEDRSELTFNAILDALAEASTCKNL